MVSLCQMVVCNMMGVPWQVVQVVVCVVVQVGVQVVRMVGGAMDCQQQGITTVHHRSMGLKVGTVYKFLISL